jgi:hypothetical protein
MTENQSTELATAPRPAALVVHNDGPLSMFFDTAKFEHGQRVANMLAASTQVPDAFRGKPADCFIMIQLADQLKMNPLMLMQKCYVIKGKPGMEAQLVIALMNENGPFEGPVQWRYSGEGMDRECTAFAKHGATKETCEMTVSMKMAKAEGWIDKAGSKWKTMPDLMLKYRSATYRWNTTCPEVKFGFTTIEELGDMPIPAGVKQVENVAAAVEDRLKDVVPDAPQFNQVPEPKPEPELEIPYETAKPRRGRCAGCDKLFQRKDLEPTDSGPMCVPCRATKEACDEHEKTFEAGAGPAATVCEEPDPLPIAPEERFYCKDCEETFGQPAGGNGDLCRKCLSKNIIDRTPA